MEPNQMQNIGQNITNAFTVVLKTYENLEKFWVDLDETAMHSSYVSITPKFIRWKSDSNSAGWLTGNFIKLYQSASDPLIDDIEGLRNGPIYGVEVAFMEKEDLIPMISVAKYDYEASDLSKWGKLPSVSDHWGFHYPLHNKQLFTIESKGEFTSSIPKSNKTSKDYWNLIMVTYYRTELVPMQSKETIRRNIIDGFDRI
jgi:hypothetical protein